MNNLENQLHTIMNDALHKIALAIQGATAGEVGTLMLNQHRPATRQGNASAPNVEPQVARKATKGTRGKRVDKTQLRQRILDIVASRAEGVGAGDIAKAAGADPIVLQPIIKKLRDEGRLIKHGDKRLTTYTAAPWSHEETAKGEDVAEETTEAAAPETTFVPDEEAPTPEAPAQTVSDKLAELHKQAELPKPDNTAKKATTNRYRRPAVAPAE